MKLREVLETCAGATRKLAVATARTALVAAKGLAAATRRAATSAAVRRTLGPAKVGARVIALSFVLTAVLLGLGALSFRRVEPGTVAVKQVDWGDDAGILPRDFRPGLHFGPRNLATWHVLDARTHHLRFGWKSEGGDHPVLEVRTKEGNAAQVAVTVPYRIKPGEAHRIVAEGLKSAYRHRVKATAEKVLSSELALLSSEEFAGTDARLALASNTLTLLNASLAAYHVEADAVLIGPVFFSGSYEKKLQERQLESQSRLTNASLARRQEMRTEIDFAEQANEREETRLALEWAARIEAERLALEKAVLAEKRATEEYVATRRIAADGAYEARVLDGTLALLRVEGLKERLKGESLGTAGGRLYLAREAARNLRFRSVTLNSGDPRVPSVLDLDELAALLVGGE